MDESRAVHRLKALPCVELLHRLSTWAIISGILLFAGCLSRKDPTQPDLTQVPAAAKVDDFFVVDCLLPGQIRILGGVAYVTRRQPIKTAARDCQIRGGEYVAFDRANYATSLKIWLPLAEEGDLAAQTYVGEIFEKGLGVQPDYAAAAVWYRRAAEKSYARAAINLGSLYEQGRGVPKDPTQALNWYRRAAGLRELNFEIVPETQAEEMVKLREKVAELQRQLKEKEAELARTQRELKNLQRGLEQRRSEADSERSALMRLRRELEERRKKDQTATAESRELERAIKESEARVAAKDREVIDLRAGLARLEKESSAQRAELARIKQQTKNTDPQQGERVGYPMSTKTIPFGNYHALVIGNNDYRLLRRLETAVNDAKEVGRLLREQYGYKVTLLLDASRDKILTELDTLRKKLGQDDNLLIYYAGHGELDRRNESGHWLPIDADPESRTYWIPIITISEILNIMTVKQLLVVADSCYAGTMPGSATGLLELGSNNEENLRLLRVMTREKSRIVMTSGGVEPVIDKVGGQQHSLFAQGFIELLRANAGVLPGREMFRVLQRRVAVAAYDLERRQIPEYGPIKFAGHSGGDFLFVRAIN